MAFLSARLGCSRHTLHHISLRSSLVASEPTSSSHFSLNTRCLCCSGGGSVWRLFGGGGGLVEHQNNYLMALASWTFWREIGCMQNTLPGLLRETRLLLPAAIVFCLRKKKRAVIGHNGQCIVQDALWLASSHFEWQWEGHSPAADFILVF